jgi:FtsH-binding integral membrane protein
MELNKIFPAKSSSRGLGIMFIGFLFYLIFSLVNVSINLTVFFWAIAVIGVLDYAFWFFNPKRHKE